MKYDCDWIICASKYRGTIYLCEFYTEARERHHVTTDKQSESWGFKFEQCMVAGIFHYIRYCLFNIYI